MELSSLEGGIDGNKCENVDCECDKDEEEGGGSGNGVGFGADDGDNEDLISVMREVVDLINCKVDDVS